MLFSTKFSEDFSFNFFYYISAHGYDMPLNSFPYPLMIWVDQLSTKCVENQHFTVFRVENLKQGVEKCVEFLES